MPQKRIDPVSVAYNTKNTNNRKKMVHHNDENPERKHKRMTI